MRAAVFHGPRDVRIDTVPDPTVEDPTDAVVRITRAAICGSDLWFYRGHEEYEPGWQTGHEWLGVVEDIGHEVRTLAPGDTVLAPFAFSDGTCEHCRAGLPTSCVRGGFWAAGNPGGQAELIRCPLADGTLVKLPGALDDETLDRLVAATDVLATGHHAAVSAGVGPGRTAVVIGDGAVGLCAVSAARRLGAERIVAVGHHPARLEQAARLGATDLVAGQDPADEVMQVTGGGAECVLECVGAASSMRLAAAVARPGGTIGYVGVPHGSAAGVDLWSLYLGNVTLRGGVCPARRYADELIPDVLAGDLDVTFLFDFRGDLSSVPAGYQAMDSRRAIKALIRVE